MTYPSFLCKDWILKLWKKFMCKRQMHLFDEVGSFDGDGYLHCDACGLHVVIKRTAYFVDLCECYPNYKECSKCDDGTIWKDAEYDESRE